MLFDLASASHPKLLVSSSYVCHTPEELLLPWWEGGGHGFGRPLLAPPTCPAFRPWGFGTNPGLPRLGLGHSGLAVPPLHPAPSPSNFPLRAWVTGCHVSLQMEFPHS